jgi:3-(3-hydroxy-phenyl)propionate hydroxylase
MFDIAIIGYGPAGATLAKLLGQAGLSVLVLEKDQDIYPLPRAIHFDGEIMRVFQAAGLRAEVEAVSRPGLKGMRFVNAQGETLLIRGGTSANGPHGCANNYYFHQPELEHVLREGVARHANVQVRLGQEVIALRDTGAQVELDVKDTRNGASRTETARYAIGCDGARSLVRRHIGTAMTDLGLHQPWLVFDVLLGDHAPALPDHTTQHCDPARPMTYCNVTGRRRRWEIMLMPGDDPARLVEPETLWHLVGRWLRPDQARIERAVIYTFHSIIAETWRQGRLLLAGDAAHQTPPFLGQGLCAAVRDVANLAWKLEAVLRGRTGDELLDTYASERAPHVRTFIDLAVRLGDIIQTTDPAAAAERDRRFRSGEPTVFEFPSPGLGPGLLVGSGAPVGQPFPQPRLADGRLLDEHLGNRCAVIACGAVLADVDAPTRSTWADWNAAVLHADAGPLADWLDQHDAQAVLLRPDRYVMGLARTAAELVALTRQLPAPETATVH